MTRPASHLFAAFRNFLYAVGLPPTPAGFATFASLPGAPIRQYINGVYSPPGKPNLTIAEWLRGMYYYHIITGFSALSTTLPMGVTPASVLPPTILSNTSTYQYFLKSPSGQITIAAAYNNATVVTADNAFCGGTLVHQIDSILHVFPPAGIVADVKAALAKLLPPPQPPATAPAQVSSAAAPTALTKAAAGVFAAAAAALLLVG